MVDCNRRRAAHGRARARLRRAGARPAATSVTTLLLARAAAIRCVATAVAPFVSDRIAARRYVANLSYLFAPHVAAFAPLALTLCFSGQRASTHAFAPLALALCFSDRRAPAQQRHRRRRRKRHLQLAPAQARGTPCQEDPQRDRLGTRGIFGAAGGPPQELLRVADGTSPCASNTPRLLVFELPA